MSKRKINEPTDLCVEAYVHSVNPVKQAMHSTTRYFDGHLQTSETELVRFVSFSPEKFDEFQSAEHMKSPVKLSNIRIKPVAGGREVTVSRSSKLDVCSKKLNFDAKSRIPVTAAPHKNLDAITAPNITCSVTVKMPGFYDQEETKTTIFGARRLRTAVLADTTQIMKLPLWEANISKVKQGNYYHITNVVSSLFNGSIQLNTTPKTCFIDIPPFENVYEDMSNLDQTEEFEGSVKVCRLVRQMKCVNCTKALSVDNAGLLVKCMHCLSKQKTSDLTPTKTVHLNMENSDGVAKKFVVFNTVLANYLDRNNMLQHSDSEIEDHILLSTVVKITFQKSTDIATHME